MLDETIVTELIEKLRIMEAEDPSAAKDVLHLLESSYTIEKYEPAAEIAKTICEILEPERLGTIRWMNCKVCGSCIFFAGDEEKERGVCSSCFLGI